LKLLYIEKQFIKIKEKIMKKIMLIIVVLASIYHGDLQAQADGNNLEIFGYFQAGLDHTYGHMSSPMNSPIKFKKNTFLLQQLNLMAVKRFNPSFTAFINLEMTNSYSSDLNWGSFNLEEAWLKYECSDAFNIKAGLLIPTFNNLNEIKNKTPLLPYILRPLVYEDAAADLFKISDFLPERAYFQVYGQFPLGKYKLDYAAYIGNSEPEFVNSGISGVDLRGADTTTFKLLGGRVGIHTEYFKAGVSLTRDKDNQTLLGLGPISRTRVGGDLSFQVGQLSFEGEVISVYEPLTNVQKFMLEAVSDRSYGMVGKSFSKLFYYGLVNYDFSDKIFGYVTYQYANDKINFMLRNGVKGYSAGVGYRPIEDVVLKLQYVKLKIDNQLLLKLDQDHYQAAISVYF
jgi:hypothetical protein